MRSPTDPRTPSVILADARALQDLYGARLLVAALRLIGRRSAD